MTRGSSARLPFVGRTEELAALHDAFEAAADGLVVALVGGDAGVGKTSLAQVFATELRAEGVPVHWGSCVELGGAPPFWPWVQVVRSIGDHAVDTARADLEARAEEPFAAFDALHEVLRSHAGRPRVVVLDDLHAADLGSLELLRFLVSSAADLPLLVVGIHRLHELRTDVARDVALAAIARGGRRVVPALLGRDEVEELLGPGLADEVADEVLARSGGNALYVEQLVDTVRRDGPGALAQIPAGIRAAVRARLEPLPPATRELLVPATVLAPGFRLSVLAEVAGAASLAEVREALAPAFGAGLLAEGPDGIAFTHVLVRDVLHEELAPERRAAAHAAAARAFEARVAPDDAAPPAVVAQHLVDAGAEADPLDVARWAGAAADAARRLTAHRDAARWFEVAARHWGRASALDAQGRALVDAIEARAMVGDGAEAVALSTELADLARRVGSAELLAQAALARAAVFEASQDVEGPPLLQEALDHPGSLEDIGRRADLLAGLAGLLGMPSIDGVRRDEAAARAAVAELEALAATGDRRCRARLAEAQLNVSSGPLHHHDRRRWLGEYTELMPAGRDAGRRLVQLYWAASLAFEAGELHEVDRLVRDWEALADRCDSAYWRWRAQMARASLLFARGRLDAAEELATDGGGLVASLHPAMAVRVVTGIVVSVRMDQGRMHEVGGLGRVNLGLLSVLPMIERGEHAEARRLLSSIVAAVDASSPDDLYWLCLQSLLAMAADGLGEAALCQRVADDLEPYLDQIVMWGRSYVFGMPVSEAVGVARRGAGDHEAAADAFCRAMAWADRVGAVGFGARARVGLASVLPLDDPRRVEIASEARATASRLGLGRVVAEADALLVVPAGAGEDLADGPTGASRSGEREPSDQVRARVRTLGRFEVVGAGGHEPARWTSRKARDALKVLICRRGRSLPREELIELLWPDVDVAVGRSRLSVVLSMLRAALDPDRRLATDPLRADRQSVALDLDVVSVDVEEFLAMARDGLREGSVGAPDPTALVMAVALGDEGDFLAEDPYADWARPLRGTVDRTRRELLRALAGLAEGADDPAAAVRWWNRLVELDPEDRSARRALADGLARLGRDGELAALGIPPAGPGGSGG
jgi:DNA-binding SARP family transcriptional activator